MLAGSGVMINWSDVAPEHRMAYYEWHCREHMLGRVAIHGFIRGRRYLSIQAKRDFLIIYEVKDLTVLTGQDYLAKANRPSALTQRTTPVIKNSIRGLCQVKASFGIGVGGYAMTLRFEPHPGAEMQWEQYLKNKALPQIAENPEIMGAHWLQADTAASREVPVERQGRPTVIPNGVVVLEGVSRLALENAATQWFSESVLVAQGCSSVSETELYALQIMVNAP
jgi:hypothetical protein